MAVEVELKDIILMFFFGIISLIIGNVVFGFVALGLFLFFLAGACLGIFLSGKVERPDVGAMLALCIIICLAAPIMGPVIGYQIDSAIELPSEAAEKEYEDGKPASGLYYLDIDKKRAPRTDDSGTSIAAAIVTYVWTKDAMGDWFVIGSNSSSSTTVALSFTMQSEYGGFIWLEIDSWTNTYVDVVATKSSNPNVVDWIFEDLDGDDVKEHAFKMFLKEEFGDEAERSRITLFGVQQAQTVGDANPVDVVGVGESGNDSYIKWQLSMDTECYGIAIKQIYVECNDTTKSDIYVKSADMWYGTIAEFKSDTMESKIRYYIFDSEDPADAKWCVYTKNSANEYNAYVCVHTIAETTENYSATLYVVYWEEGYIETTTQSDSVTVKEEY